MENSSDNTDVDVGFGSGVAEGAAVDVARSVCGWTGAATTAETGAGKATMARVRRAMKATGAADDMIAMMAEGLGRNG